MKKNYLSEALKELATAAGVTLSSGSVSSAINKIMSSERVNSDKVSSGGGGNGMAGISNLMSSIADNIIYGSKYANVIVDAARKTPSAGPGWCLAWVKNVLNNAKGCSGSGFGQASAKDCYNSWNLKGIVHKSENIPTGAIVFGAGSGPLGRLYGHIGICVQGYETGKTILIRDNIAKNGAGFVSERPFTDWVSEQDAASAPYARYWGYILYEETMGK